MVSQRNSYGLLDRRTAVLAYRYCLICTFRIVFMDDSNGCQVNLSILHAASNGDIHQSPHLPGGQQTCALACNWFGWHLVGG
jgi:hypothetical protein